MRLKLVLLFFLKKIYMYDEEKEIAFFFLKKVKNIFI